METKGIVSVFTLIVAILVTVGITFFVTQSTFKSIDSNQSPPISSASPSPVACTQEAKQCQDGSYVGRTGRYCDFALCPGESIVTPSPYAQCKSDSDCPGKNYTCEATQGTQGTGVAAPGSAGQSSFQITKGECKLKQGNVCAQNADCAGGLMCNAGVCVSPIGKACNGPADATCSSGYECIKGCGPPVVRYPDDSPTTYSCLLKGYKRLCPICLGSNTRIATPNGDINVKNLRVGMPVWSVDVQGQRVATEIALVSHTPVPPHHEVIHLILADAREVWVSPGHPTINKSTVGDLRAGDAYDGARIVSTQLVPYGDDQTYDLLPASDTGYYWANGILLGSTLK